MVQMPLSAFIHRHSLLGIERYVALEICYYWNFDEQIRAKDSSDYHLISSVSEKILQNKHISNSHPTAYRETLQSQVNGAEAYIV
ncbi:hypothetical protein BofuT4_P111390.1 [Botrytis cinerea T4]|uniref:Uncharacterized protein n=1 Tax=Botryotinia fuckeliana (strain T4) TaxID=999810 RepID=G2Y674_BOTF4|nr:hypothetical protein BofuT4_P111390.1 [Botrytis cinerea T4]